MVFIGVAKRNDGTYGFIACGFSPSFYEAYWKALDTGREVYGEGSFFVYVVPVLITNK